MRRKVISWYHADCYTRLSPTACVIAVATRWHPEDLIGYLTSDNYRKDMIARGQTAELFEQVIIEAKCENAELDPLGREYGDALAPELGRGKAFLDAVEAALPAYEWNSQFQGRPQAQASGQADVSLIQYIEKLSELPEGCEIARGWDLALTEATAADFSAGPLCAYHRDTDSLYIMDMPVHQKAWAKMKPIIVSLAEQDLEKHGCALMGVEAVTGFKIAHSELRTALLGKVHVRAIEATKSKLMRAQPWINLLEAKRLVLLRGEWNKAFLNELAIFPMGKHDDRVDGVSVAYALFKRGNLLLA
jgi:predicted phage terminase large subunit-like protein